jgi:hypothetical protein
MIGMFTATRPPPASISSDTARALSAALAYVSATAAPSVANFLAIAAPIPRLPPVTRATLPSRLMTSSNLCDSVSSAANGSLT